MSKHTLEVHYNGAV